MILNELFIKSQSEYLQNTFEKKLSDFYRFYDILG